WAITAPIRRIPARTLLMSIRARSLWTMFAARWPWSFTHSAVSGESMTQKSRASSEPPRSSWGLLWEAFLIIVLGFVLLIGTQAFVGRPYVIPSASMEPTLHGCEGCTNDRIFVEKLSYYFSDPDPGD